MPVNVDCSVLNSPECDYNSRVRKYPLKAPLPQGALDHFMLTVEGDGTPWSYLSASLMARDLAEFGARWHAIRWGHFQIIGDDPQTGFRDLTRDELSSHFPNDRGITRWLVERPKTLAPTYDDIEGRPTIVFHTYSEFGNCHITRHTDAFAPRCYAFETESVTIAEGGSGYVV